MAAAAQTDNPLSLHIIPLDAVLPHEAVDPERVTRLIADFQAVQILKNPPVVTAWQAHYMVLDGATRVTALKQMGFRYIVAQVIPWQNQQLNLESWSHVKQGISAQALLARLRAVPEIVVTEAKLEIIQDLMLERGGLCYLVLADHSVFIVEAALGINRLLALNSLVETYLEGGQVNRVASQNPGNIRREFPQLSGLFIFPDFTVEQVLQIAKAGHVLPAGLTRFIIPGRVLRLNLDLHRLQKDEPLAQKVTWLNALLAQLAANHRIRYYEEPLYLLDE